MTIQNIMGQFENAFTDWKQEQIEEFEGESERLIDYLDTLDYDFNMVKIGAEELIEDEFLDVQSLNDLFDEIIDDNNDYNIDRDEFLNILEDYESNQYAEICAIYDNAEDLGCEFMVSCYSIPKELESYIDYEKFGNDLMYDEGYEELDDGRIVYISL